MFVACIDRNADWRTSSDDPAADSQRAGFRNFSPGSSAVEHRPALVAGSEVAGSSPRPGHLCVGSSAAERRLSPDDSEVEGSSPIPTRYGREGPRWAARSNDPGSSAGSSPAPSAKLYAVTRADLPVGLRAAQVGHALLSYALQERPVPDNLVILQVSSQAALEALQAALAEEGIDHVGFHEPDLDGELTAIAVDPAGGRHLSQIPLMR